MSATVLLQTHVRSGIVREIIDCGWVMREVYTFLGSPFFHQGDHITDTL